MGLRNKLLYRLTSRMRRRDIEINDAPYLERYYVGQLFGVTFYLHRFLRGDGERHLHNHPWTWGRALVLTGGYIEEYATDVCPHAHSSGMITALRKVRFWNKVDAADIHRISCVQPETWTLFFHGPRATVNLGMVSKLKGWGFFEQVNTTSGDLTVFYPHVSAVSPRWWEAARCPVGHDGGQPL